MPGHSLSWQELCALYPQLERALADRGAARAWHALMLIGPQGIGKQRMAQLLAQALLCQRAQAAPCGQCAACRRVEGGAHANLITLAPASREKSIKIDPTRRALDALSLHPLEPGLRAVLIPDMDLMTEQAQNAVLKSLEEPDAQTVFLMTTGNERALLPTILSRCRLVRLPPWPLDRTAAYLERNGVDGAEAREWARLSGGRPEQALQMAQDPHTRELLALVDATFSGIRAPGDIVRASNALKGAREDAGALLQLLEARVVALLPAAVARTEPAGPGWDAAGALALRRVLERVFEARRYLAANVSWQGVCDRLLIMIAKEIHQCPV